MKILLAGFGLAAIWSLGPTLTESQATPDGPETKPATVKWREISLGGKTAVTVNIQHGSLDFDRSRVRMKIANGKTKGDRWFRRLVNKGRRFYVTDKDGEVKVRFNAKGWGKRRARDVTRITIRTRSTQGANLGHFTHTVGSGGGSGRGSR